MIVPFVVYDKVTGVILRTGSAPATMVAQQAAAGERVTVGTACDECDWVHPGSCTIKRDRITTRAELDKKAEEKAAADTVVRKQEQQIYNKMRDMAIIELERDGVL